MERHTEYHGCMAVLSNMEMLRAILDGRKIVMRRVVKQAHLRVLDRNFL